MKKKKYLLYRFLEFDVVHQCGYRSFPQAERFPVISDTRTLRYLVTLLKRKKKKLCTYHSIIRLTSKYPSAANLAIFRSIAFMRLSCIWSTPFVRR